MMKPEVQPKDCGHCQVANCNWTMVEAARHYRIHHPEYLKVLETAVDLAQASRFGMEPWNG